MQNGRVSKLSEQPLSPLDGRYRPQVRELGEHFSEAGLNRARVHVEIEWLIWLVQHNLVTTKLSLSAKEIQQLRALITNFSDDSVARLAKIEATTRHDVKAVEYFIREELEKLGRSDLGELVHFACTSEDINNLAYARVISDGLNQVMLPKARGLAEKLREIAKQNAAVPMLSRTHGQPATPTTLGKELAVFVFRMERQLKRLEKQEILGKFSGGNRNICRPPSRSPRC